MPSHKGTSSTKPPDFEEAVKVLLRSPNVEYLLDLSKKLKIDPHYLYYHELSVGLAIQRMLFNGSVRWDGKTILQFWSRVLRVALERVDEG